MWSQQRPADYTKESGLAGQTNDLKCTSPAFSKPRQISQSHAATHTLTDYCLETNIQIFLVAYFRPHNFLHIT